MQKFDNFVAYHADNIHTIIISDLHLSPTEPALLQAFLALLHKLQQLPHLSQLFILGDWFEAWLGDDIAQTPDYQAWLYPLIYQLQQLTSCQIFVMRGNRDFLLGQEFCSLFHAKLIDEPFILAINNKYYRLEHGDKLCTDDKKYQWFRRVIQNPISKKILLSQSLTKRQEIAENLRKKSQMDNAKKTLEIMDVNPKAVNQALLSVDGLIHGHTHRPAIHDVNGKQRIVLGDWRVNSWQVSAQIAIFSTLNHQFNLIEFNHSI